MISWQIAAPKRGCDFAHAADVRLVHLVAAITIAVWCPRAAHAASDSVEAARFPTIRIAPAEVSGQVFAQVVAAHEQSLGDARRFQGELAVGGRLILDQTICRQLDLGAHVRIAEMIPGGHALSGEQWLSGCFAIEKNIVPVVMLGHRLEWNVRPAFSASPIYWRAPLTRETISVDLSLVDADVSLFEPTSHARFRFGHAAVDISYLVQNARDIARSRIGVGVDMSVVQWFEPRIGPFGRLDHSVDVLRVSMRNVEEASRALPGWSSNGLELSPVSLTAKRLGGSLLFDARIGWALGTINRFDRDVPRDPSPKAPPPVLSVSTVGGEAAIYGGNDTDWGGVRYSRSVIPTLDFTLGRHDRLSAWITHRMGRAEVSSNGFLATTTFWDRSATSVTNRTGGIDARAAWSLDGGVRFEISAEMARTFYARVDETNLSPRAEWGFRSMAMVTYAPFGGPR